MYTQVVIRHPKMYWRQLGP